VPADTPFFPDDLVMRLSGLKADHEVVAACSHERRHPTVALWSVALANYLADCLADPKHRAIHDWLDSRVCSCVAFDDVAGLDPFFNVNKPEDLSLARRHIAEIA
jgi:molybdopterin-guanine dinucleotide biosynthesis protein A